VTLATDAPIQADVSRCIHHEDIDSETMIGTCRKCGQRKQYPRPWFDPVGTPAVVLEPGRPIDVISADPVNFDSDSATTEEEERMYKCPECGKEFKNRQGLGSHRQRAHSIRGENSHPNRKQPPREPETEVQTETGETTFPYNEHVVMDFGDAGSVSSGGSEDVLLQRRCKRRPIGPDLPGGWRGLARQQLHVIHRYSSYQEGTPFAVPARTLLLSCPP